jgi:hypothetical protein
MRKEILDFMKQCEHLLSLALQTRELSEEECAAILYYANELQEHIQPICSVHEDSPDCRSGVPH